MSISCETISPFYFREELTERVFLKANVFWVWDIFVVITLSYHEDLCFCLWVIYTLIQRLPPIAIYKHKKIKQTCMKINFVSVFLSIYKCFFDLLSIIISVNDWLFYLDFFCIYKLSLMLILFKIVFIFELKFR